MRKPNASKQQAAASGSTELKIKLLFFRKNQQIILYRVRDGAARIVLMVVVFDKMFFVIYLRLVFGLHQFIGFRRGMISPPQFS